MHQISPGSGSRSPSSPPSSSKAVPAAFAFPLGFGFVALWLFLLAYGFEGSIEMLHEGGPGMYAVAFFALVGAGGAAACAGVGGPRVLALASAALPWLIGALFSIYTSGVILSAIVAVSPADYNTILAAGSSELLSLRILGSFASAALFIGLAGSFAVRAQKDGSASAFAGAAVAVAGAGLAIASCMEASTLRNVLGAIAGRSVDPALRQAILMEGTLELSSSTLLGIGLAVVGAVAAVVLTLLAARASERPFAVIVGTAAAALVLLAAPGLDSVVLATLSDAPGSAGGASPWAKDPAFQPVLVDSVDSEGAGGDVDVDVLLTSTGRVLVNPDALKAATDAPGKDLQAALRLGRDGRALRVAIDARAPAGEVAKLVDDARAVDVSKLVLVGGAPPPPAPVTHPLLRRALTEVARELEVSVTGEATECAQLFTIGDAWSASTVPGARLATPPPPPPPVPSSVPPVPDATSCVDVGGAANGAALMHAVMNLRAGGHRQVSLGKPPAKAAQGLLALLGTVDDGKLAALFGDGAVGIGALGSGDDAFGTGLGGLGVRGAGAAGDGSGLGGVPKIKSAGGAPTILGSLPKEVIQRVVKQHVPQVQYCYERELMKNPELQGKIKVKWVINGEGRVTQASIEETTMKSAAVEGCIVSKVKTWVFPKPKGGGIVIISYPFIFKSA